MNKIKILGIETSCDETALTLVEAAGGLRSPRFKVLKNLVASQIKIHRPFGGVVPNLAKREHLKNLPILFKKLFKPSAKGGSASGGKTSFPIPIDLICVTVGPGLEPALWTGINFAKSLYKSLTDADKTSRDHSLSPRKSAPLLVGANHLEGHLYSFLLSKSQNLKKIFPAIALIASGGHTILLLMKSLTKWKKLGETRDDAAGEAFDKVARMLQLPYPGGPEIEKLACRGNPQAINFPRPMIHDKSYDFSFSGLKTSVLYFLRDHPNSNKVDIAASFQKAIIDVLVYKTIRAAKEFSAKGESASGGGAVKSIMLSGGVAANKLLRRTLRLEARKMDLNFFVPDFKYNLDNAVMIAVAGYMARLRKKEYRLGAQGNLSI